jgi:hypothetical protein
MRRSDLGLVHNDDWDLGRATVELVGSLLPFGGRTRSMQFIVAAFTELHGSNQIATCTPLQLNLISASILVGSTAQRRPDEHKTGGF